MTETLPSDLTGKILIAMPSIGDPRFESAVVYVCAHSPEGTMGLIVNRQSDDVQIDDVLSQLEIEPSASMGKLPIYFGGPVEMGRGFVLHEAGYDQGDATLHVNKVFSMTASRDILREMAMGRGPQERLFCLGYAGWGPGQLEEELASNGWLICEADPELVFEISDHNKWKAALATLGVSPAVLSGEGGRA